LKTCNIENCNNTVLARGLCRKHYQSRDKIKKREEYTERGTILKWINENLSHDGDVCLFWPFPRSVQSNGYGCFKKDKKQHMAHKYICTVVHGEQPAPKSVVRHLCGNGMKGCVNPKHLEVVTGKENLARGDGISAINSRKTHCVHGHILSEENLLESGLKNGKRLCKICYKINTKNQNLKRKERLGSKDGRKLNEEKVILILNLYKNGKLLKDLSIEFGVSETTIYNVVKNKSWKNVKRQENE